MKKLFAAALAALAMLVTVPAQAETRVQVGVLQCSVDPGIGLIIVSRKDMTCKFKRNEEAFRRGACRPCHAGHRAGPG